jgi:hypothetical protein
VELRRAHGHVPQGVALLRDATLSPLQMAMGSTAFSTEGLGLTAGNPLSLIQTTESADEAARFGAWFDAQWAALQCVPDGAGSLVDALRPLSEHRDPMSIYALMLHHVFSAGGEALDEDSIVKAATGIRNTLVWKKLFKFQRDGVVGAIDKLNRFGGCIIADSVGLGKTFEALAIIKYHELRNDRVLVLCPKRLRDNWALYKSNDRRNVLAADRLNYDVLNHTDLSRDAGLSGDIDLAHVNWGNYDLVVIDESHNFRNKSTHKDKESRYHRLMRKIIREGVKTYWEQYRSAAYVFSPDPQLFALKMSKPVVIGAGALARRIGKSPGSAERKGRMGEAMPSSPILSETFMSAVTFQCLQSVPSQQTQGCRLVRLREVCAYQLSMN